MKSLSSLDKIADMRELKAIEFWQEVEGEISFQCKIYDVDSTSYPCQKVGEAADNSLVIDIRPGFFLQMKKHGFSDKDIAKIIHYWTVDEILPYRVGVNGFVSGNNNIVFSGIVGDQTAKQYRNLLDRYPGDPQDEECITPPFP